MTGKGDFTEEEWQLVAEGPPAAGMILITAEGGGSFRESWALAKAYADARRQHGESELLDAVVAAKPDFDRRGAGSPAELKEHGLRRLREAAELLGRRATSAELEDYRGFVLEVATRVANAHKEHGERVSPAEHAALEEVAAALGARDAPQAEPGA